MLDKLKVITLYDVKQARKHALNDNAEISIKPGRYSPKKLTDDQINHFLDFLQYGEVMQDVANESRSVKLSTGRRAIVLKAVRTDDKSEIIRL